MFYVYFVYLYEYLAFIPGKVNERNSTLCLWLIKHCPEAQKAKHLNAFSCISGERRHNLPGTRFGLRLKGTVGEVQYKGVEIGLFMLHSNGQQQQVGRIVWKHGEWTELGAGDLRNAKWDQKPGEWKQSTPWPARPANFSFGLNEDMCIIYSAEGRVTGKLDPRQPETERVCTRARRTVQR